MRKAVFYPKLAYQNVRRNGRFYLPFILTCVATAAMFYIMCFLTFNSGMNEMTGSDYLKTIFVLGCIVIGIFSTIFLFYTNSFLMKRRQKELGLYNVLGMGKGNIAGVLFFETLYTAVITLVLGLALGVLLSKLMLLILCRLIRTSVPFGFEVSEKAVLTSVCLFCGIFVAILISNLVRIKLSNPVELLRGGDVGEKEPKTKWLLAVLGIVTLGAGYFIAVTTESPLQALALFFVAVILVIAGTYLLFTASSIAVLKRLKSRPGYYYKTKHFIPVSGMIYRMKQNAVGLANICILSTMVLVMVSGTVCLYLGTDDMLNDAYPEDIVMDVGRPAGSAREVLTAVVNEAVDGSGLKMKNVSDLYLISFTCIRDENDFGDTVHSYYDGNDNSEVCLFSSSEYEQITGRPGPESGCALVSSDSTKLDGSFRLLGKDYSITGSTEGLPSIPRKSSLISSRFYVVVPDDDFEAVCAAQPDNLPVWYYSFDLDGTPEEKSACCDAVNSALSKVSSDNTDVWSYGYESVSSRDASSEYYYAMNGGFLFLGLFLGIVFLIATALIIYYKQLSEGYDDKERFEIMQKVGLSRPEIKKAIHSQILIVFFLPLGMAVVHIAFAFKMITKLLLVFSLTNVGLFAVCTLCTVAAFAAIYAAVYLLTAKVYYRIVS